MKLLVAIFMLFGVFCFFRFKQPEVPQPQNFITNVEMDTEPVGVGLGVIGGGIVIAAWVTALMRGGDHD